MIRVGHDFSSPPILTILTILTLNRSVCSLQNLAKNNPNHLQIDAKSGLTCAMTRIRPASFALTCAHIMRPDPDLILCALIN